MSANNVNEILSWYSAETPGTVAQVARLLSHGKLAGTGRLLILPVDHGFEHGPTRSFAGNPEAYDPEYHVRLAIEAGCSAYAAPLGFLEAIARPYAYRIPLILKLNDSDKLVSLSPPISAMTASVDDALRLGCAAVGFTIYPGSSARNHQYEELRDIVREARDKGLAVITWAYPRGDGVSKEGESGVDVVAYAAHIAAQLGTHIIKVKAPTSFIEEKEAKLVFEKEKLSTAALSDRVREVIRSAFNGKRIVLFSGGEDIGREKLLTEVREIADGGGFGSIIGRNAFQRPFKEAVSLLGEIIDIYVKASRVEQKAA
jgi:class I fructose-bisphosphate aldolase